MGVIELLLVVLLVVILLGAIFWVAGALGLPHPVPLIIVAVVGIVVLLTLVGSADTLELGNGR